MAKRINIPSPPRQCLFAKWTVSGVGLILAIIGIGFIENHLLAVIHSEPEATGEILISALFLLLSGIFYIIMAWLICRYYWVAVVLMTTSILYAMPAGYLLLLLLTSPNSLLLAIVLLWLGVFIFVIYQLARVIQIWNRQKQRGFEPILHPPDRGP